MTAPEFKRWGDTAFRDGVNVNTGLLKDLEEDTLYLLNNRLPGGTIAYTQYANQGAVSLPTFSVARWAFFDLGRLWGSPLLPAVDGAATIDLILLYTVSTKPVRIYAFSDQVKIPNNPEAPGSDAAYLDTETNPSVTSGPGRRLAVTATPTRGRLQVKVRPGVWQHMWLAVRCEADLSSPTSDSAAINGGGLENRNISDSIGTAGVPGTWIAFPDSTSDTPRIDQLHTIAFDDGSSELFIAEHAANEYAAGVPDPLPGGAVDYLRGDLGSLELYGRTWDFKQSRTVEGARYWPGLRWYQPTSAGRIQRIFALNEALQRARLPQVIWGGSQINLNNPDYPGLWRIESGSTVGGVAFATQNRVFRRPYYHDNDFRSSDVPHLEVQVPFAYIGRGNTEDGAGIVEPVQIDVTLRVVDTAGNVADSGAATTTTTIEFVPRYPEPFSRSSQSRTARWIALSRLIRDGEVGSINQQAFSHDGFTDWADLREFWYVHTDQLDISGLTQGTDYFIEILCENNTLPSGTRHWVVRGQPGGRIKATSSG